MQQAASQLAFLAGPLLTVQQKKGYKSDWTDEERSIESTATSWTRLFTADERPRERRRFLEAHPGTPYFLVNRYAGEPPLSMLSPELAAQFATYLRRAGAPAHSAHNSYPTFGPRDPRVVPLPPPTAQNTLPTTFVDVTTVPAPVVQPSQLVVALRRGPTSSQPATEGGNSAEGNTEQGGQQGKASEVWPDYC